GIRQRIWCSMRSATGSLSEVRAGKSDARVAEMFESVRDWSMNCSACFTARSGVGFLEVDEFAHDSRTRRNPHLHHRKPQKNFHGVRADPHAGGDLFVG